MDTLHRVLRTLRPETKSRPDHFTVFREFLAQLDALRRQAMLDRPVKTPIRRRAIRRAKTG
ncbi:hypothetical protein [Tardiphaga sp.]|jgi:hypothetical protein|uniref:hypothetical protein n=1 Tax=Tardiphaga sp. TaxID=1926292 RepID=UPI0019AC011D|nr:hypothetical protein [Tardiphaga sp.]MBC7577934.1 hypothetical protein [Tardiphaga sp.]